MHAGQTSEQFQVKTGVRQGCLLSPFLLVIDWINLSHADQVTIFRLRCGHNRLRCHMFNCFKVGETARCECGADKQDAQHILQDCILYSDQRSAIWPTEVSLKKKLYGSGSDLRLTTEFIRATSLTI